VDQAPELDLGGWHFGLFDDVVWSPWGSNGNARANVLAADAGATYLSICKL
jgi:hypothetical protein